MVAGVYRIGTPWPGAAMAFQCRCSGTPRHLWAFSLNENDAANPPRDTRQQGYSGNGSTFHTHSTHTPDALRQRDGSDAPPPALRCRPPLTSPLALHHRSPPTRQTLRSYQTHRNGQTLQACLHRPHWPARRILLRRPGRHPRPAGWASKQQPRRGLSPAEGSPWRSRREPRAGVAQSGTHPPALGTGREHPG